MIPNSTNKYKQFLITNGEEKVKMYLISALLGVAMHKMAVFAGF